MSILPCLVGRITTSAQSWSTHPLESLTMRVDHANNIEFYESHAYLLESSSQIILPLCLTKQYPIQERPSLSLK